MRPNPVIVVLAAAAFSACDAAAGTPRERLTTAEAERLPGTAQLWSLCPSPDVSDEFRERVSRTARQRARALIQEVRRRPHALVTKRYKDSHTGEPFDETTTVRELAEEHLENPGIKGVPCQRALMAELHAAVAGRPAPTNVTNERTYTLREVVAALQLNKEGGVYRSPGGCEINGMHFDRFEVEAAREESIGNHKLITSTKGRVGVEVFRPTPRCEQELMRSLARLDA